MNVIDIDTLVSIGENATSDKVGTIGEPSSIDIHNFESEMNSDNNGLGDSFLDEIFELKSDYTNAINDISVGLEGNIESPADIMRFQFELTKVTMQQELIAKGAGKTTQNVETLIKAQ